MAVGGRAWDRSKNQKRKENKKNKKEIVTVRRDGRQCEGSQLDGRQNTASARAISGPRRCSSEPFLGPGSFLLSQSSNCQPSSRFTIHARPTPCRLDEETTLLVWRCVVLMTVRIPGAKR